MRILNRVLAALLALGLFLGGLLVAAEIAIATLTDRRPFLIPHDRWYSDLVEKPWRDQAIRLLFIALLAAGLVLLLLQLIRRKPLALSLQSNQPGVEVDVSRKSLEKALQRAAERVDGVANAKAKVGRSNARIRASSNQRIAPNIEQGVNAAASRVFQQLQLTSPPSLKVSVSRKGES